MPKRHKSQPTQLNKDQLLISKPKVREFKIPTISMSQTLDEYFKDHIEDVHLCLVFLERFADKDPQLAKLIETYHKAKSLNIDIKTYSLDQLVEDSQVERGDFRRLILATIDYLCTDIAQLKVKLSTPMLVEKSLAIAMDETLEESYDERKGWLEFLGFRPVSKNQQLVNVNVSPTQNTVVQQGIVNGLPSFTTSIAESEKITNQAIKQTKALQPLNDSNVIDLNVEKVEEKETINVNK